jgi:lysophospholipase L1-like esterase
MSPTVASAWRLPGARVVFYGTSLTRSGGWAEVLAGEMQAANPSLTAVNTAEGGRDSRWGLARFAERELAPRPALVFPEFTINDAVVHFNRSVEQSGENLVAMLDPLRAEPPAKEEAACRQVVPDGLPPTLAGYARHVLPVLRHCLERPAKQTEF